MLNILLHTLSLDPLSRLNEQHLFQKSWCCHFFDFVVLPRSTAGTCRTHLCLVLPYLQSFHETFATHNTCTASPLAIVFLTPFPLAP